MKKTTVTCDRCGGERFGGPTLTVRFPEALKQFPTEQVLLCSMLVESKEYVLKANPQNMDADICEECRIEFIHILSNLYKDRGAPLKERKSDD